VPSPLGSEPALSVYTRTRGRAEHVALPIRDLVARIDPRVPIGEIGSLASFNERSMGPAHWLTRISAMLDVIASDIVLRPAGSQWFQSDPRKARVADT
jgi:hypothetical protein